jgi:methylmalonyl-CoA/ethylmalonyl-CoA epimerase
MSIKDIGPVMQIAFVPTDFDAALKHWTEVMGVGPFYLIQNIELGDMRYMGEPTDCKFSLALAYWGDMQIELIRPENDAPGIYRGQYGVSGDVLHHTCILTSDLVQARKTAEAAGAKVLVEGTVGDDGGVIYVDTGGGAGSIVEILQPAAGSESMFAMIKAASVGWDGSDPVRKLG